VRSDVQKKRFKFPKPVSKKVVGISKFLAIIAKANKKRDNVKRHQRPLSNTNKRNIKTVIQRVKRGLKGKQGKGYVVADIGGGRKWGTTVSLRVCPTIIKTRAPQYFVAIFHSRCNCLGVPLFFHFSSGLI
jgi:hypothetical protein